MPEFSENRMRRDAYARGRKSAWERILAECLRNLDIDDPASGHLAWIAERAETVAMLRNVCEAHGDNNWPDDLSLSDVIEKHLWRHLPEDGGVDNDARTD